MRVESLLGPALASLGANPDTMTLSGSSLGGYMAQELAIIFSSHFKGLGIIGAGSFNNDGFYMNQFVQGLDSK
jgi:hypothetical protein